MEKYINTPIDDKIVSELKAGDYVYLTGTVYTARDAAHKRLYEALQRGEDIPLELQNNIIYYLGPSPAREGRVRSSAPQAPPPPAAWINTHHYCLKKDLKV